MADTVAENPTYDFSGGLITDQSPVNPVPGSATDCFDYEMQPDGSIRRRRGFQIEAGGDTVSVSTLQGDESVVVYRWKGAGGEALRVVTVVQVGTNLLFFEGEDPVTADAPFATSSLTLMMVTAGTEIPIRRSNVSMASGRGRLLVTGRYIEPFVVTLDDTTVTANPIALQMRDFSDSIDDVPITAKPLDTTEAILYNLYNRGWSSEELDSYFTSQSEYPSKTMVSWLGYLRVTDAGTQEGFGTKLWNSAKMAAEVFGASSAPKGRLLVSPFDTTEATNILSQTGVDSNPIEITSASAVGSTVTLNLASAHGFTTTVNVIINLNVLNPSAHFLATVVDTDTITIDYPPVTSLDANAFFTGKDVVFPVDEDVLVTIPKPDGYETAERPTAVGWFAGRAWFAGAGHEAISDCVFFSQLVENDAVLGRCYQSNDPTAEHFNAAQPTDGGVIKIPGLSGVHKMEEFGSSLILFSTSGVWEIRGGEGGFTATSYVVRQISDYEVGAGVGVTRTGMGLAFASRRGLGLVQYDTNSGFLSVASLTSGRLEQYWVGLPMERLANINLAYDSISKRLYTLVPRDGEDIAYTEALVLDMRFPEGGRFYKIRLPHDPGTAYVAAGFGVEATGVTSAAKALKLVALYDDNTLEVLDMNSALFSDDFGDEAAPFWEAASDNIKDWHKHKYVAHYLYTHAKRTISGYVFGEDGEIALNPGSATVRCKWNWTDSDVSGKYTTPQSVYRALKAPYLAGENGEAVIVRRHKIRGSGRSVMVRIDGTLGYDSHILGWVLQYGVG